MGCCKQLDMLFSVESFIFFKYFLSVSCEVSSSVYAAHLSYEASW